MTRFSDISIRNKLITICMLTSGLALSVTLIASFTGFFFVSRTATQERISSLARVIGSNCVAPLVFNDHAAAEDTLKALSAEPHIALAWIYKEDGTLFAEYRAHDRKNVDNSYLKDHETAVENFHKKELNVITTTKYRFHQGALHVTEPILFDGAMIGMVEISYDLSALYQRLVIMAVMFIAILLISFLVAYIFSSMVQRMISGPITNLNRTMNTVSRDKNYAIRVKTRNQDELGMLLDGFNAMLSEIQARDEKLHFTQFSVDHMGDAALWMDPKGCIVNVNQAACRALGYSRKDLTGLVLGDIDPVFKGKRWEELWENVRRKKAVMFESLHFGKDGRMFPVEFSANFLEYQNKQFLCSFSRNITERKSLQMQLAQAQKMEAIGTLAGGVAHDLNNILGGLVGLPDLLLLDLPPDSPIRKTLLAIKKSGEKAAAIVQDMLTLARRGLDLRRAVNLNDIIHDYLRSMEHEKIDQFHPGVQFELKLDPELPNILGSELHLFKSLMNLASNAAEAMAGSGKVVIRTSVCQLTSCLEGFQTVPEGEYAMLSIEDEGEGMSETDMTHIFEPFYTKKKMGRSGTGLGMSVVSGTVKDHKGFIDLKSIEGRGTRFDLYFPITHQIIHEKESNFVIQDYMGHEKILVIDDVKEQREMAGVVLGKLGYQVEAVSSGEEALVYLEKGKADLLVLDMIMEPGMDGLETYRRILERHPGQKAVVVTGFAETDRVREVLALGAGAYIRKPYTLEKIGMAVRDVLGRG